MKSAIRVFIVLEFLFITVSAQQTYFPPLTGNQWETVSPSDFGWCQPQIDSLYQFLESKHTKSFIILKNGKIVLEKYFGNYTVDSIHYWASASKSLASVLSGIAQQKGLININNPVSQYIGTGWSSAPSNKEILITVKDLLQMTSGLDDSPPLPCNNEDTAKTCLNYNVDAGSRWAYHTGAYKKVQDVVSSAAALNYNVVTNNWIRSKIGMGGFWFDQTYYSKTRDMARFGLLALNRGIWMNDTIIKDTVFYKSMLNSSQNYNLSYGYLWWLNGKSSYLNPGIQLTLPGPLIPNAPSDLYAALGKNDQKIYAVPSSQMVVVRQGNSAGGVTFALSTFDNRLWDYINKLVCNPAGLAESAEASLIQIFPNPANSKVYITGIPLLNSIEVSNGLGQTFDCEVHGNSIDVSQLKQGIYFITLIQNDKKYTRKLVID